MRASSTKNQCTYNTIKPVYNGRCCQMVVVVPLCFIQGKRDHTIVVPVDRWSLFEGSNVF